MISQSMQCTIMNRLYVMRCTRARRFTRLCTVRHSGLFSRRHGVRTTQSLCFACSLWMKHRTSFSEDRCLCSCKALECSEVKWCVSESDSLTDRHLLSVPSTWSSSLCITWDKRHIRWFWVFSGHFDPININFTIKNKWYSGWPNRCIGYKLNALVTYSLFRVKSMLRSRGLLYGQ